MGHNSENPELNPEKVREEFREVLREPPLSGRKVPKKVAAEAKDAVFDAGAERGDLAAHILSSEEERAEVESKKGLTGEADLLHDRATRGIFRDRKEVPRNTAAEARRIIEVAMDRHIAQGAEELRSQEEKARRALAEEFEKEAEKIIQEKIKPEELEDES